MRRATRLLLAAMCLSCGCRAFDGGFLQRDGRQEKAPKNASAQRALKRPPLEPADSLANRREASRLAPPEDATNPLAAPTDAVSREAELTRVMDELLAVGAVDPQAQAELMRDLRESDPKLWPMMIRMYRTAAARRQREESATPVYDGNPQPHALAVSDFPQTSSDTGQFEQNRAVGAGEPAAAFPDEQQMTAGAAFPAEGQIAQTPPNSSGAPGVLPSNSPTAATADAVPPVETAYPLEAQPLGGMSETGAMPSDASSETPPAESPKEHPSLAPPVTGSEHSLATASVSTGANATLASYDGQLTTDDWRTHLSAAINDLEMDTQQLPGTTAEAAQHARLRLLQLVAGKRDDALRAIPGIPASEQDFWTRQMYGLATLLDVEAQRDPSRRASEAAEHLLEANRRLREMGSLVVKNLAFCDEVTSFGIYHEFEQSTFRPQQEVLLYAEVENFKCDESAKGYHSALRSSYQIIDRQGRPVDEQEYAITEEYCRNPRRDFFIRYHVFLPERIFDGEYTLRLTIVDTLSQKIGEASIDFAIEEKNK